MVQGFAPTLFFLVKLLNFLNSLHNTNKKVIRGTKRGRGKLEMSLMKKLIVANWKMNPISVKETQKMFLGLKMGLKNNQAEVVVCPPFVYLQEAQKAFAKVKNIAVGSQNCFWENSGAFTGEVSALMLKDLGVRYVILGHSERVKMGETSEIIAKKLKAVLGAGLLVIVCVGESLEEKNKGETFSVIEKEIKEIFSKIKGPEFQKVVIAYEPDWAIGTETNCSPDNALTVALFIKKVISENFTRSAGSAVKILYGGSVDSSNAKDYLIGDSIGGLLVGGASLDIKEFLKIVQNVC